jgi:hypothetical protein
MTDVTGWWMMRHHGDTTHAQIHFQTVPVAFHVHSMLRKVASPAIALQSLKDLRRSGTKRVFATHAPISPKEHDFMTTIFQSNAMSIHHHIPITFNIFNLPMWMSMQSGCKKNLKIWQAALQMLVVSTFIVALLLLLRLQLQTSKVQQSLCCLAWKIALVVTTTIRSGVTIVVWSCICSRRKTRSIQSSPSWRRRHDSWPDYTFMIIWNC